MKNFDILLAQSTLGGDLWFDSLDKSCTLFKFNINQSIRGSFNVIVKHMRNLRSNVNKEENFPLDKKKKEENFPGEKRVGIFHAVQRHFFKWFIYKFNYSPVHLIFNKFRNFQFQQDKISNSRYSIKGKLSKTNNKRTRHACIFL